MIGRLALLLALGVVLVAGQAYKYDYLNEVTADKDFLLKQKRIYDILFHVYQPELSPDLYKEGQEFKIEPSGYTNKEAVTDFLHRLEHGFVSHGTPFAVYYDQKNEEQARSVFRILFYAKDFDTFYKTALFCRNRLNHSLFGYMFYLAIFFRPDTKYIKVPQLYEMAPFFFYNNEVFAKAHHAKEFGKLELKHSAGYDTYIIPYNYSNFYLNYEHNYEQRLNYFTEDIGLNSFYFFYRNQFPWFLSTEELNIHEKYRGEDYFFGHKQLYNRYNLERISNDLSRVEDFNWNRPFGPGYWPTIQHPNGLPLPSRTANSYIPEYKYHYVQECEEYESRISQAVDSGIVYTKDGKYAKIYTPEGLNILGSIIEGNSDSINPQYYGNIDKLMRNILGFNIPPLNPNKALPSALEKFVSTLRDPAIWRIYKRILHFYYKYKENLKPYKPEEIQFPQLKFESVEVDKLVTYFDYFDSTISNALAVNNVADIDKYLIQVRQYRLNHKPFNININLNAEKPTKATIKIFLGPKYSVHSKDFNFAEHYKEFFQLDIFIYDLAAGLNKITRNCHDFAFTYRDSEPLEVFYKKITNAIDGTEEFKYEKRLSGFPDRLILPKGKPEGLPFQLFIYVAPVVDEPVLVESHIFGNAKLDSRGFDFPLDRPIQTFDFHGPNFFFKDVLVYHKQEHDQYIMF